MCLVPPQQAFQQIVVELNGAKPLFHRILEDLVLFSILLSKKAKKKNPFTFNSSHSVLRLKMISVSKFRQPVKSYFYKLFSKLEHQGHSDTTKLPIGLWPFLSLQTSKWNCFLHLRWHHKVNVRLAWWSGGWEAALQCSGCRFDPWLGDWGPTCLVAKKPQSWAGGSVVTN